MIFLGNLFTQRLSSFSIKICCKYSYKRARLTDNKTVYTPIEDVNA